MVNRHTSEWTDAMRERATELWNSKDHQTGQLYTVPRIAALIYKEFGVRVTPNSVRGQVWRYQKAHPREVPKSLQRKPSPDVNPINIPKRRTSDPTALLLPPLFDNDDVDDTEETPRPFLETKSETCQYIYGDARSGKFCENPPVGNTGWCEEHRDQMYDGKINPEALWRSIRAL